MLLWEEEMHQELLRWIYDMNRHLFDTKKSADDTQVIGFHYIMHVLHKASCQLVKVSHMGQANKTR